MRIAGLLSFVAVVGMVSCDPGRPVVVPQPSITSALGGSIDGAIFTTTPGGTIVNENVHYASKLEVYLDGGPGPNAPQKAAGLPDGNYYFQVTDPSGKVLLSEDPAKCRKVEVVDGVIVGLLNLGAEYPGGKKGAMIPCHVQHPVDGEAGPAGHHDLNTDADHGGPPGNAKVVQLMPFADTPNKGGVYKAWIITEAQYLANGGIVDAMPTALPGKDKGYEPDPGFGAPGLPGSRNQVKTDNFKTKGHPKCDPPLLIVKKFHDLNNNGVWDAGEEEIFGWPMKAKDPIENENTEYTKVEVMAMPIGTWSVTEELLPNTLQTASYLDGAPTATVSQTVSVDFQNECTGESHEIIFGNIGVTDIEVCKVYDLDGDGEADHNEPKVPGWKMQLSGGTLTAPIVQTTGAGGCTTFEDLLPGTYTVTELMPTSGGWQATGDQTVQVTAQSLVVDGVITGTPKTVNFTNICIGTAEFGTKGYWHNKNGLIEMTDADIAYANSLLPYSSASSYFDAGDEPFDGLFTDGTKVAAVTGDWAEVIAPEGSARAEVSAFLVDTNATGDPREQLAQQLLAFIFNVLNRLGGTSAAFQLPGGEWIVAGDLIDTAVDAWSGGTAAEQTAIKDILDALNNSAAVPFIHPTPCPVVY